MVEPGNVHAEFLDFLNFRGGVVGHIFFYLPNAVPVGQLKLGEPLGEVGAVRGRKLSLLAEMLQSDIQTGQCDVGGSLSEYYVLDLVGLHD